MMRNPSAILILLLGWLTAVSADDTGTIRGDARPAWRTTRELPAEEAFQAAAATDRHVFAIGSRSIGKYDRETGQRVAVSSGDAQHLNSGFLWEGRLYSAHSNYPLRPERSDIRVLEPNTMELTVWKDLGETDGSLTWAIRHDDHWWCMFAYYGDENGRSYLARFNDQWEETGRWRFPREVIERLGTMSVSGGVWREGGFLVTGHDERELYHVRLPEDGGVLQYVATVPAPFSGQGIAADPATGGLVGIDRRPRKVVFAELHE
jgi:hypothetical protein